MVTNQHRQSPLVEKQGRHLRRRLHWFLQKFEQTIKPTNELDPFQHWRWSCFQLNSLHSQQSTSRFLLQLPCKKERLKTLCQKSIDHWAKQWLDSKVSVICDGCHWQRWFAIERQQTNFSPVKNFQDHQPKDHQKDPWHDSRNRQMGRYRRRIIRRRLWVRIRRRRAGEVHWRRAETKEVISPSKIPEQKQVKIWKVLQIIWQGYQARPFRRQKQSWQVSLTDQMALHQIQHWHDLLRRVHC